MTIMSEDAELTIMEAAAVLNVSHPFLVKLLDEGALPYRRIGKHQRLRMEDVTAYKAALDCEREEILDRLVHEAQEQDMGYAVHDRKSVRKPVPEV